MNSAAFKAAIASKDRRTQLEALRDHLADELAEPRAGMAIAPIAKQLDEVLEKLAALDPVKKGSKLVDLNARIARKQAAAVTESPAV